VEGEWARQYGFDLTPQEWIDFVPANYLNSTHPDAIFVQKRVVVQHARRTPDFTGDMLKTITAKGTETRQLAEDDIPRIPERVALRDGVKQRGPCPPSLRTAIAKIISSYPSSLLNRQTG
jgi:N-hydroxyarylamine O-acetyltransferase